MVVNGRLWPISEATWSIGRSGFRGAAGILCSFCHTPPRLATALMAPKPVPLKRHRPRLASLAVNQIKTLPAFARFRGYGL